MHISKIFLTFAVFVPAKPLNNAQIGGAFYYIFVVLWYPYCHNIEFNGKHLCEASINSIY